MRKLLAIAGSVALSAAVLSAGKTPPDIPVNLWFDDTLTQGLTASGTVSSNTVTADYIDGLQNVQAIIQGGGNFRFTTQANTRQAATRCLWVDFGTQSVPDPNVQSRQCVDIQEPMLGYPKGAYDSTAIASLTLNETVEKLIRMAWTVNGYVYRLGYGTDMENTGGTPDSPPVIVKCIAVTGGQCSEWTLQPADPASYASQSDASVSTPGAAALYRFKVLKSGEGTAELVGYYSMPFSETFTRK